MLENHPRRMWTHPLYQNPLLIFILHSSLPFILHHPFFHTQLWNWNPEDQNQRNQHFCSFSFSPSSLPMRPNQPPPPSSTNSKRPPNSTTPQIAPPSPTHTTTLTTSETPTPTYVPRKQSTWQWRSTPHTSGDPWRRSFRSSNTPPARKTYSSTSYAPTARPSYAPPSPTPSPTSTSTSTPSTTPKSRASSPPPFAQRSIAPWITRAPTWPTSFRCACGAWCTWTPTLSSLTTLPSWQKPRWETRRSSPPLNTATPTSPRISPPRSGPTPRSPSPSPIGSPATSTPGWWWLIWSGGARAITPPKSRNGWSCRRGWESTTWVLSLPSCLSSPGTSLPSITGGTSTVSAAITFVDSAEISTLALLVSCIGVAKVNPGFDWTLTGPALWTRFGHPMIYWTLPFLWILDQHSSDLFRHTSDPTIHHIYIYTHNIHIIIEYIYNTIWALSGAEFPIGSMQGWQDFCCRLVQIWSEHKATQIQTRRWKSWILKCRQLSL